LEHRRGIWSPCHVDDVTHDLLVVPDERKLGLFWLADSVPVATAVGVTVQYVGGAFRADANRVEWRALLGIHRVPAGVALMRVSRFVLVVAAMVCRVVGGTERLVTLGTAPRFGWFRFGRVSVSAVMRLPFGLGLLRPIRIIEPL
jgi:hypothetical protein